MEYERFEFPQPLYGDVAVLKIGNTMIDTGHVAPVCQSAVRDALDGPLSDIERVIHTHPHIDHVGGSQTISALADLPHIVPAGEPDILFNYSNYLRRAREDMTRILGGFSEEARTWDEYFPISDEYLEERIDVSRELRDGDTIVAGGFELEAISTPGHADPHLGFWYEESATLFSGDLIDPDGRYQYGPLLGDVGDYKASLRRIEELDPAILVPMHGTPMSNPQVQISQSLTNVEETETRLQRFFAQRGPCYAREFVTDELGVAGGRTPFLTLVVYDYLRHLDERGLVEMSVTHGGIRVA